MAETVDPPVKSHFQLRAEMPNFDYVRLVAASLVLFSHSFTIAEGSDRNEPLVRLLGEGEILGIYAVCVFFIISGFLVTKSAFERRSLVTFAASRILRVFPGLFVCQLVTATVLGVFFTDMGKRAFLASLIPLRYAIHYTIDPAMSWQVQSVTFYQDAAKTGEGLNGSLWTIQQELACYTILALLLVTRTLRWPTCLAIVLLTLPFFVPWSKDDVTPIMDAIRWSIEDSRVTDFFWVAPSFFMGAVIFFFWLRKRCLPAWPMLLCLADFAWAVHRGHYYDHFALYAAYPLLWIATSTTHTLPSLKKFGDISYGVYLYGWPCEQAVRGFMGPGVTWYTVFVLAGIMTVACAYASWRLVEKPALSLKKYFNGPPASDRARPAHPPLAADTP